MSNNVIKAINDRREFRYITLHNKLDVLLVSDKETKQCGAALSVGVGSVNDYKNFEGLAHFLEHMLFMGSEKYPIENHFSSTVAKYKGSYNAYTSDDHTCYHFTVSPMGFLETLDIWAQFFICPSLKEEAIKRELNAVDSEYQNSLSKDWYIYWSIMRHTMKPNHPLNKFSCGNRETLMKPNIYETVNQFYNEHYSANLMKLVIVGNNSLDELDHTTRAIFSQIKNKNVNFSDDNHKIYNTPIMMKQIPIRSDCAIGISFEFKYDGKYKITKFLDFLLGHSGTGSLQDYLSEFNAYAGAFMDDYRKKNIVHVICIYPNDMISVKDKIVKKIYQYINNLKLFSFEQLKTIYDDKKKISENKFNGFQMPSVEDFTMDIAKAMIGLKNPSKILSKSYFMDEFTDDVYKDLLYVLKQITLKNSVLMMKAKEFENEDLSTYETDKWYNAKYKVQPIEESLKLTDEDEGKDMMLIDPNPYICSNVQLVKKFPKPVKLQCAWWCQDISHNDPRMFLKLRAIFDNPMPLKIDNPINRQISIDLFSLCFDELLANDIEDMKVANYDVFMWLDWDEMCLNLNGYPEKFTDILAILMDKFENVEFKMTNKRKACEMENDCIDKALFERMKNLFIHYLENTKYNEPSKMMDHIMRQHMGSEHYSNAELINALKNLSMREFVDHVNAVKELLTTASIDCLIQGNTTFTDAVLIDGLVYNFFGCPSGELHNKRNHYKVNVNRQIVCKDIVQNPKERNSCFGLFVKIGRINEYDVSNWCMTTVLNALISDEYFNQLRTNDLLGYYVRGKMGTLITLTGYQFIVQSPHKDAGYLKTRTLKFLQDFEGILQNVPEEELKKIIDSTIEQLKLPPQNLKEAVDDNYEIICETGGDFTRDERRAEFLATLTKDKLMKFYKEFFLDKKHYVQSKIYKYQENVSNM